MGRAAALTLGPHREILRPERSRRTVGYAHNPLVGKGTLFKRGDKQFLLVSTLVWPPKAQSIIGEVPMDTKVLGQKDEAGVRQSWSLKGALNLEDVVAGVPSIDRRIDAFTKMSTIANNPGLRTIPQQLEQNPKALFLVATERERDGFSRVYRSSLWGFVKWSTWWYPSRCRIPSIKVSLPRRSSPSISN